MAFLFKGFSKNLVEFYEELSENNNKAWFEEHKHVYEDSVLQPTKDFIVELGSLLSKIAPEIHAEPKVNKSIFRIYRDTRFSKDKTPYKTFLGVFFWEGERKKLECSGFYFHVEPGKLFLATGIHIFPKDLLMEYRKSVVHPEYGQDLVKILSEIRKKGYSLGQKHYKKIPRGFDKDHPNAELLLYNGMAAEIAMPIPDDFFQREILDFSLKIFTDMLPLHQWLVKMSQRV